MPYVRCLGQLQFRFSLRFTATSTMPVDGASAGMPVSLSVIAEMVDYSCFLQLNYRNSGLVH